MNRPAPVPAKTAAPEEGSWRWCAEDYLKGFWWPQDRHFVREFAGAVTCEMMDKLCVFYRIHTSIRGIGIDRYKPLAEAVNRHHEAVMTRENTAAIIEGELATLAKVYGREPLSALTRALWMKKQHPVAVCDRFAQKGLTQVGLSGHRSYLAFYEAWFKFFERPETQSELDEALSWLPESAYAGTLLAARETDANSLKKLAESASFRNRVTDRYLTYRGGLTKFK
jgi:hypothetical protein